MQVLTTARALPPHRLGPESTPETSSQISRRSPRLSKVMTTDCR